MASSDLQVGNITTLGKRIFETHDGLSNLYKVSFQELDFLIDFVRNRLEVIGAGLMGGGFGGCTINLVHESSSETLLTDIKPAYELATGLQLDHYIVSNENGTEII